MTTPRPTRRTSLSLIVALLLVTAGCSSLAGPSGDATPTSTDATTDVPTTSTDATTPSPTPTSTPIPTTTTGTDSTQSATSDGHSHSHNETGTGNSTGESGGDTAAATGEMVVVLNGTRIDLSETVDSSDSFRMAEGNTDAWHANGSHTISSVLSKADIDANASTLSYDGTTYDEQHDGTTVVYRVDGQPVDPTAYTLQDGDEVWVLVVTDEMNFSTPGSYIPPDRLHAHGTVDFVVNGRSLDFSREKWQAPDHERYFHFEGGHADPWHAHSATVTLGYGLSTLEDINASERGITYNGTSYGYDESGPTATATVTVNGEPVDPTTYYLKDGDTVRIVLESDA